MRDLLTQQVKARVHPTIIGQGKDPLIYEVVRIVMDETILLGFIMLPGMKPEAQHAMKHEIVTALVDKHARYTSTHVSVGDVITDLLDEFKKFGVSLDAAVHA